MPDDEQLELLVAEYEQTGEAYRTRNHLLHNSYYLFIIAFLLFAGAAVRLFDDPFRLALLSSVASFSFLILGLAVITHYVERTSAGALRTRVEQATENIMNADINHDIDVQRPLGLQFHVIGGDTRLNDTNELIRRESKYGIILSRPTLSAKGFGQAVLGLAGILAILAFFQFIFTFL